MAVALASHAECCVRGAASRLAYPVTAGAYGAPQPNPSGRPANSAASSSVGGVKCGNSETHLGTGGMDMDAGMDGMDGIPEDREGSSLPDHAGATSGLIPFFFISLRSPLRLARALSSAVLPAALSDASLPRRFASSASICALPSAMATFGSAGGCSTSARCSGPAGRKTGRFQESLCANKYYYSSFIQL